MKVWITFLLVSFIAGGYLFRRQRKDSFLVTFGLCALVALALYSRRFV